MIELRPGPDGAPPRFPSAPAVLLTPGPVGEPVGPTPPHWSGRGAGDTLAHDAWLTAVAERFGEPISWPSLQEGRVLTDVLPAVGYEHEQTGLSSESLLELHVEDCFSERRCDVLILLCLRNPDRVPTTVVAVDDLDPAVRDDPVLREPRFVTRPDPEHLRAGCPAPESWHPLVSHAGGTPRLRVDTVFTRPAPDDPVAARALADLSAHLTERAREVVLASGDMLILDNHRAAHGRRPFTAHHDGTDRWLRRVMVRRPEHRPHRTPHRSPRTKETGMTWNADEYGEQWAGVYDVSHGDQPDTDLTVDTLAAEFTGASLLELGVGTGRLALPLAARGVDVTGVESSQSMIDCLRAKPGGADLPVVHDDFVHATAQRRFDAVLIALNTFCYVPDQDGQIECLRNAAHHMADDARLVVETTVPTAWERTASGPVSVVSMSDGAVEYRVDRRNAVTQTLDSVFVQQGPTRTQTRTERIRYVWPNELELLGRLAGLRIRERWGDWARTPFTTDSTRCITVFSAEPARSAAA